MKTVYGFGYDKDLYINGYKFWEVMPDGSRRELFGEENTRAFDEFCTGDDEEERQWAAYNRYHDR